MSVETPQSARRAELAAFLRAQRARLRPIDVGLPEDYHANRRRTPGLRREEIAQISDISVTWYTWLEQGRKISASEQVIEALARALLLDPDQRRHIRSLAGLSTSVGETHTDDALPRLQRLVNAAAPTSPPSMTCISTTWYGTRLTSGSGMTRRCSPPTGAISCG